MKIYLSLLLGLIISSCSSLKSSTWLVYGEQKTYEERIDYRYIYLGDPKEISRIKFQKDSFWFSFPLDTTAKGTFYRDSDTLFLSGRKEGKFLILVNNHQELILKDCIGSWEIKLLSYRDTKKNKDFRTKKYQKPTVQKNIDVAHLPQEWLIYEEWNYADDIFEGTQLEKAANDGIDDVEIWYRKEEKQQLRLIVEPQQLCVEEEVKQDIFTYTKENHCYPYSIENNHIYIQKEDNPIEWEIIKLDKKEFWYRDVGAEDYRIYKCKKP